MRTFNPADYPHGCRCSSCRDQFTEGDTMHDQPVAANVTTPVHLRCVGLSVPVTPELAAELRAMCGENCPECGLPLPGPHRGTCSVSLMHGGPGFGKPKAT